MPMEPMILVEATYVLTGDTAAVDALTSEVLGSLEQPASLHTVDWNANEKILTVTARIPAWSPSGPDGVHQVITARADQQGLPIASEAYRSTECRIAPTDARIRMHDDQLDYTALRWEATRPSDDEITASIYPGAELAAVERRVQIWIAEPRTRENLGLGSFARVDAYHVRVSGHEVWIPAELCTL